MYQQKSTIAPWLLVVFAIVLLGGISYFAWYYFGQKSTTTTVIPTPTTYTESINGWKIYKNESFKYSISIPKDWTALSRIFLDGQPSKKELDEVIDFADSQKQRQLRVIVCETCKKGNQYGSLKNYASYIGSIGRESVITNQEQFKIGQLNGYKQNDKSSFYTPSNTTQYFAESKDYYIKFISLNNSNQVEEILATFKLDI